VRLQAAESDAKNAQPVSVSAERLRLLLASVKVKDGHGEVVLLFADAEVERLAEPLSKALRLADVRQDIVFFSSERRGEGLFAPRLGIAGRIFHADDAIQIIFGAARLDFADQLRATNVMPPFSFGGRAAPSEVDVGAERAAHPAGGARRDWLVWHTAEEPQAGSSSEEGQASKDDRFSQQQEQRLRLLQRLREQGLITDQEYQEKKREILRGL